MKKFSVELFEKRVVVARVEQCDTVDEAKELAQLVGAAVGGAPAMVVGSADFRRARLFTPPVTEVFIAILRNDNPKIERSGHILGPGAAFTLQIERIVREAGNPSRKTFEVVSEAEAWLNPLLTPGQQKWLHDWYEDGKP